MQRREIERLITSIQAAKARLEAAQAGPTMSGLSLRTAIPGARAALVAYGETRAEERRAIFTDLESQKKTAARDSSSCDNFGQMVPVDGEDQIIGTQRGHPACDHSW